MITGKPQMTFTTCTDYRIKNTKTFKEYKLATFPIGLTLQSHRTLQSRARNYNKLPPELTMIKEHLYFKKSLKVYFPECIAR